MSQEFYNSNPHDSAADIPVVCGNSIDIDVEWLNERMLEFFNNLGRDMKLVLGECQGKTVIPLTAQQMRNLDVIVPGTRTLVHSFLAELLEDTSTLELTEHLGKRTLRLRPAWVRELIREAIQTHEREKERMTLLQPKQVEGLPELMEQVNTIQGMLPSQRQENLNDQTDCLTTRLMQENHRLHEQNTELTGRVCELIQTLADARTDLHERVMNPPIQVGQVYDHVVRANATLTEHMVSDLRGLLIILNKHWIPGSLKKMARQLIEERLAQFDAIEEDARRAKKASIDRAIETIRNPVGKTNKWDTKKGNKHAPR